MNHVWISYNLGVRDLTKPWCWCLYDIVIVITVFSILQKRLNHGF